MDPKKSNNTSLLDPQRLESIKKANRKLIKVAVLAMYDLYKITKKTGFCIALADKNGVLLEIVGSENAKQFVGRGNFIEGSNWSEEVMGTSAVLKIKRSIDEPAYIRSCAVNFKAPNGVNKKFIVNITPLKKDADGKIEGHVMSMMETHNVVRTIIKPKADITFDKLVGESSSFKYALNQAKLCHIRFKCFIDG